MQITERTIDTHGQHLLVSDINIQGWWTSLDEAPGTVILRYRYHGTHEQFHSEIKIPRSRSTWPFARLPSGSFEASDEILSLGMLAYDCLRLMGQLGLTGKISPVRHPASRGPTQTDPSRTSRGCRDRREGQRGHQVPYMKCSACFRLPVGIQVSRSSDGAPTGIQGSSRLGLGRLHDSIPCLQYEGRDILIRYASTRVDIEMALTLKDGPML